MTIYLFVRGIMQILLLGSLHKINQQMGIGPA